MKKELLIPLAQYYTIDHVTPYTYIINKGGKYLYYFGSKHSYNPEDYQFEKIRYFFNDFVHHTTKENSIVLVEGGERPVALSEKEAMMEGAEMSFVTYLAYTADRVVTSPEIPDQMRFELMHAYFPKEEIVYYCFIQVCWQWNNTEMKIDFKNRIYK